MLTDREVDGAGARMQWDPPRNLRGGKLNLRSIPVGLSLRVVDRHVDVWTVSITDLTGLVARIDRCRREARWTEAQDLLPKEREVPVSRELAARLGMWDGGTTSRASSR